MPGIIRGIEIDTLYFTGNHSPRASIQAAFVTPTHELQQLEEKWSTGDRMGLTCTREDLDLVDTLHSSEWTEIVPFTTLNPGYPHSHIHHFSVEMDSPVTHIRLNMFPDGGISRLRVFGRVKRDWTQHNGELVDLLAAENGGAALLCSDAHFGKPSNLIRPGRGLTMADGWETARKIDRPAIFVVEKNTGHLHIPGNDWSVLKLATRGRINRLEIDTNHFKGNFPESFSLEALDDAGLSDHIFYCENSNPDSEEKQSLISRINRLNWFTLLPRTKLGPHEIRSFDIPQSLRKPITHIKLIIYPDGGVSRLRLFGCPELSQIQSKL